ncbi:MAG: hypothetical protein JST30_00270 [Armatimonadetes bacterium]|nr:hypothetical protein [Armatimonadota bacterium]
MNLRHIAPIVAFLTLSSTAVTASAQSGPPERGLNHVTVQTVDPNGPSFTFTSGQRTYTAKVLGAVFMNGGAKSNLDTFFRIAPGKTYYVKIATAGNPVVIDWIWDGVSFAAYKNKAKSHVGKISFRSQDLLIVDEYVYTVDSGTKFVRDGNVVTVKDLRDGDYVSVKGEIAGNVYPVAGQVTYMTPERGKLVNKLKSSDKVVSQRAKDKLKGGTGTARSGKAKSGTSQKSSTATGSGGRARAKKGGGR